MPVSGIGHDGQLKLRLSPKGALALGAASINARSHRTSSRLVRKAWELRPFACWPSESRPQRHALMSSTVPDDKEFANGQAERTRFRCDGQSDTTGASPHRRPGCPCPRDRSRAGFGGSLRNRPRGRVGDSSPRRSQVSRGGGAPPPPSGQASRRRRARARPAARRVGLGAEPVRPRAQPDRSPMFARRGREEPRSRVRRNGRERANGRQTIPGGRVRIPLPVRPAQSPK